MDDRSNELGLDDLFSVKGKVVLVTGGSRGIGEMIAAGFLANGAKVYISSRKADACDATAERLAAAHGGECTSLPGDLSGVEGTERLAAQIAERVLRQFELGVDGVIMHGATPAQLAPVVDAYRQIRPAGRFEHLPANPGLAAP